MASKPKKGRPTKYKSAYCEELYEHMAQGFSYESFAGRIRVCRDTLYEWESKYPEFSYIKKVGKDASLLKYEELIMNLANGVVEGNSTAAVWYGKNMFGWTDKQQIETNSKEEKTITVNYKLD